MQQNRQVYDLNWSYTCLCHTTCIWPKIQFTKLVVLHRLEWRPDLTGGRHALQPTKRCLWVTGWQHIKDWRIKYASLRTVNNTLLWVFSVSVSIVTSYIVYLYSNSNVRRQTLKVCSKRLDTFLDFAIAKWRHWWWLWSLRPITRVT